jgi:hypothetical protein
MKLSGVVGDEDQVVGTGMSDAQLLNWSLANFRLSQFLPLENVLEQGLKTAAVSSGETKIASVQH